MMLSALAYKLRHRQRLAWMEELFAQQWWPLAKLQESADRRTRELAIHAGRHVPYYREIFSALHLVPESIRFPEDWATIPLLDKETLRRQYEELISEPPHARRSYVNHTGGSTGVPVQFLTDDVQLARMGAWLDFVSTWAGWRPGELRLELWGNRDRPMPPSRWERLRASLAGSFAIPVYNYTEKDLEQWWQVLLTLRPTIIYGYPSVLADFSIWLEAEGNVPSGVKGVFSSAEVLYAEQRAVIERAFNCKVYNQYGSKETPCVACECPEGGMHLFINWNRVEFIDTVAGKEGGNHEIVVTPLFNYAQPLFRYRIGDLGRMHSEPCSCGRGFPLMDLNIARSRDYLFSPTGERFYPGFFTRLMDGRGWVRCFQFVQETETDIALYVVPEVIERSEQLRAGLEQEVTAILCAKMGDSMRCLVHLVEGIDRTKAGKHRYVVNTMREPQEYA